MNELYYGDNLDVLRRKVASGSVDLCYIDPPFNSKRNYFQIYNNQGSEDRAQAQAFVDTWNWGEEAIEGLDYILDVARLQGNADGARWTQQTVALIRGLEQVLGRGSLLAYLVHMTLRIVEIHRVLKPTGSFYLHCDPTASHYLKLVLDAVFCGQGGDFVAEIIWRRTSGKVGSKRWPRHHDVILNYAKQTDLAYFKPLRVAADEGWVEREYRHEDERGRYSLDNLTGAGRTSGPSGQPWRGVDPGSVGAGRHWRYVPETLDKLDEDGRIYWPKKGQYPKLKQYLHESNGTAIGDLWTDIKLIGRTAGERLGYETQKPEALLERIIEAGCPGNGTVLDAYCGCGTTVAVAQRLGRRWIGIDVTYQSIALILKRFQDTYEKNGTWPEVEASIKLDGVPRDLASAVALANRKDDKTRKEFEKWAVLTYSRNQARINDKKGADGGIDGTALFFVDKDTNGKVVFQVKSGKTGRGDLAKLNSDRQREKAEFGVLICMDLPTPAMLKEVQEAGKYRHPLLNREDDRLQVVTVAEIIPPLSKRLDLPWARTDAVKAAAALGDEGKQAALEF